jgi:hypothetical protein
MHTAGLLLEVSVCAICRQWAGRSHRIVPFKVVFDDPAVSCGFVLYVYETWKEVLTIVGRDSWVASVISPLTSQILQTGTFFVAPGDEHRPALEYLFTKTFVDSDRRPT